MVKPTYEELASQIEALQTAIIKNCLSQYDGVIMGPQWAKDAVAATPAACLAQIRAEAGKESFVEGYLEALGDPDSIDREHANIRATYYSRRLLQGK